MAAKKKTKKVKKKTVKKAAKKKIKSKKTKRPAAKSVKKPKVDVIGVVTHFFPQVKAAVVKLKKPLAIGDTVLIKGATTDFKQKIQSMQIDHVPITQGKKGDEIGLRVNARVREHDILTFP